MTLQTTLLLWTLLIPASAIPIENGVEGTPEIECGPHSITVNFATQANFEGHVFVKGRFGEAGCRTDQTARRVAALELPFDKCGVKRMRSLSPRGVFVSTTVIITFHPQFITKVDRAYTIQCFYMEADKTVSQELEVSELTTGFQTNLVPMPTCRYDILEGSATGPPVRYTVVGEQVYHKWTCDTETVDTFCMTVHSCFVNDGANNTINLLDINGCAQDRYLLRNLEYLTDLMAGQETHVFKFADLPALYFQCQITIVVKEPGETCTRPTCPDPVRGKREANDALKQAANPSENAATQDVLASFESFDQLFDQQEQDIAFREADSMNENFEEAFDFDPTKEVCLEPSMFGLLVGVGVVVVLCMFGSVAILIKYKRKFSS